MIKQVNNRKKLLGDFTSGPRNHQKKQKIKKKKKNSKLAMAAKMP